MRISAALAAVVVAVALTACGSAANSDQTVSSSAGAGGGAGTATVSGPPATATASTTTAQSDSTTTATTTGTSTGSDTITTETITTPDSGGAGLTTGTTAAADTSACVAGDLTLAAVGPNSAPGTAVLGFTLKNTSASSCHTGGWPGVALYAAGSTTPLTTSATRSTSDVLGNTPETEIVLAPGDEASFRLVLKSGGSGCQTAVDAQFIAPNDTAAMKVTIPDGGASYCGEATVSPLEPGATGTGQ